LDKDNGRISCGVKDGQVAEINHLLWRYFFGEKSAGVFSVRSAHEFVGRNEAQMAVIGEQVDTPLIKVGV